jgi:serine/threonine protein kinase
VNQTARHSRDTLPVGFRLMDYDVEGVLGVGGFGVVYRAREAHLQRTVAIKEYLPASMATRDEQGRVILRSPEYANAFAMGLQSFINEARLLARFDHPSLVRVFRFWEDNGTAYMVMPCYEGQTLYAARKALDGPPDEAWLKALMDPLLGALDCLHREHVFHRDVAPDNILLIPDADAPTGQRPVLLDFGAARRVITDHTQSLTAILKPSFAPIEQYAETTQLRQGPWTDLYALAAVLHYCVTGRTPVPATARTVHDDLVPLSQMAEALAQDFGQQYSPALLATIDHALAVRPDQRLASVAQWRQSLNASRPFDPGAAMGAIAADRSQPTTIALAPPPEASSEPPSEAYVPTMLISRPDPVAVNPTTGDQPQQTTQASRGLMWAGIALGLASVVALSAWSFKRQQTSQAPDSVVAAASGVQASAPVSAVAPGASRAKDKSKAKAAQESDRAQAILEGRASSAKSRASEDEGPREARAKAKTQDSDASAEARSPRQACGGRVFIAMAICMKRMCEKPAYRSHAQCVHMRQQEEAQRQREQSL